MRLAGILPSMWLSAHDDVPFQRDRPGNGVSCTQKGLGMCVFELFVCDLSGILINLVNEHHADLCVCVICLRV